MGVFLVLWSRTIGGCWWHNELNRHNVQFWITKCSKHCGIFMEWTLVTSRMTMLVCHVSEAVMQWYADNNVHCLDRVLISVPLDTFWTNWTGEWGLGKWGQIPLSNWVRCCKRNDDAFQWMSCTNYNLRREGTRVAAHERDSDNIALLQHLKCTPAW